MAKLTDKQRKQIIADSLCGATERQLAKKYGVSSTTIHRTIHSDPEMTQKVAQKKEEDAKSVLDCMEKSTDKVCSIIDIYLDRLLDIDAFEKLTPVQLSTVVGTLIDKWAMVSAGRGDSAAGGVILIPEVQDDD